MAVGTVMIIVRCSTAAFHLLVTRNTKSPEVFTRAPVCLPPQSCRHALHEVKRGANHVVTSAVIGLRKVGRCAL